MKTTDLNTQFRFVKQKARAPRSGGAVVHCCPVDEPHDVSGNEVCWCDPTVEDFQDDGGGIMLLHNRQVWN